MAISRPQSEPVWGKNFAPVTVVKVASQFRLQGSIHWPVTGCVTLNKLSWKYPAEVNIACIYTQGYTKLKLNTLIGAYTFTV